MEEKLRAHVIIKGKVQGVFFRFETQRTAKKKKLTGWVQNKNDGSVEAVFEGKKEDVQSMVTWCSKGSALSIVGTIDVKREDFTGEYSDFVIL